MGEVLARYYMYIAFEPSMIFTNLVYAVCIVLLYRTTKRNVRSIMISAAQCVGLWAIITAVNGFIDAIPFNNSLGSLIFIGYELVLCGYAVFVCKYAPSTRLVYGVVFSATERCVSMLSGLIPLLMTYMPGGKIVEIVVRNLLMAAILLVPLFIKRFGWHSLSMASKSSVIFVTVYSVFSLSAAVFSSFLRNGMKVTFAAFTFVVMLGFVGTELLGYWLIYHLQATNRENLELLAITTERESSSELLRLTDERLEDLRKIRHDTKNWIANMRLLFENGKYDDLRRFFESVEERVSEPLSAFDCGNKRLNSIVDLEARKAKKMGVKFSVKAVVPSELPFPDSEMCSLLTNLMDNALEAAVASGKPEETVNTKMQLASDGYLYIAVNNPISDDADKSRLLSLRTTKKDALLHGYGTKITDDIVRRYKGAIVRDIREGRYCVDVMLDTMWNKGKENTDYDKNQRCGMR